MNLKMPALALTAQLMLAVPTAYQASSQGGWLKIEHVGESDRPVRPLWLTSRTLFVRRPTTVAPLSAAEFDRIAQALLREGIESLSPSPSANLGTFQWTLSRGEQEKVWTTGPQDSRRFLQVLRSSLPGDRPGLEKSVASLQRLVSE